MILGSWLPLKVSIFLCIYYGSRGIRAWDIAKHIVGEFVQFFLAKGI